MVGWLRAISGLVCASAAITAFAQESATPPLANCIEIPGALNSTGTARKATEPGVVQGNVLVVPLSGNYDRGQTDIRAEVANRYYAQFADSRDFLFVFSTFEFSTGDAIAFYNPIKNDTAGIGQPAFDRSRDFGSQGVLQGYIDMAAVRRYGFNTREPLYSSVLSTMAHEVMHRWGVYSRFRSGSSNSDALLGQARVHWSYFANTDASLMYGSKWESAGAGAFTALEIRKRYSWPDLYLAGLASAAEFGTIELLNGPAADASRLPVLGARFEGSSEQISLAQIVAAEGVRQPDFATSRKRFRAGLILLTRPSEVVRPETLAQLERVRIEFAEYFSGLTHGRGVIELRNEAKPAGVVAGPIYRSRPLGQQPGLPAAVSWLRMQQKPDGRFEDRPATSMRDTSFAIQALSVADSAFFGITSARQWVAARNPASTDALAWQALAGPSDSPAAAQLIILGQRTSLGLRENWPSDPWTAAVSGATTIALRPPSADGYVSYAVNELPASGQWPAVRGGPGRLFPAVYANALLSRSTLAGANSAQQRLSTWIRSRINPELGLASLAMALGSARAIGLSTAQIAELDTELRRRQGATGDWGDSVYVTSLAVLALQSAAEPNLQIDAPLQVLPSRAYFGQLVGLLAIARNVAGTAPPSTLRWYRGAVAATNAITPKLPSWCTERKRLTTR